MTDATEFRTEPPRTGAERESLAAFLDYHRGTFLWKCSGLTDEQLRHRGCPPSGLSLLGLMRHLTDVEHGWFSDFSGVELQSRYRTPERRSGQFDDLESHPVADVFAAYQGECERSRQIAAGFELDDIRLDIDVEVSLRYVYLHLIEEYARHNGHADLLREAIDGATGE